MRRERRPFPPNCTVCDLDPSRFLAYREKQKRVLAEYGFILGVPCRTPEQKAGHRRYMSDWQRRYRSEHSPQDRRDYMNNWHLRKRLERRLGRKPTEDEIAEAEAAKDARIARHEEHIRIAKEKFGFDLGVVPMEMSPEEADARKRFEEYLRSEWRENNKAKVDESRRKYRREVAERKRKARELREKKLASLAKAREAIRARSERRRVEREEAERLAQEAKRQEILGKFGFDITRPPETPEERRGQKLYALSLAREKIKRIAERREAQALAKREARKRKVEAMRQEREATEAARLDAERQTAALLAEEREANRAAYLAGKAAKKEDVAQQSVPAEPIAVLPVVPVPEAPPHPLTDAIAAELPRHPFRGLLLDDTAPTDDEMDRAVSLPRWSEYTADDDSASASGGGGTPTDPPSNGKVATGGDDGDDEDERRRELEEKIRRIREQYGFTFGKKPVTPEEIEGKKRYIADRNRETAIRNRTIDFMLHHKERVRKAAAKKRKATIARKKREAAAQTAREAKAAERAAQAKAREEARQAAREAKRAAKEAEAAAKTERKALLADAYKTFKYKITAYKRKAEKMRRHLKFPRDQQKWTPEQKAQWNDYLATSRKELDDWLVERMRKELGRSLKSASRDKQDKASISAELIAKREAREKRKQEVFEKYGFHLGKKPVTPEEVEGRKRYDRAMLAAERERHREQIREYQKLYRRRRRQQALEEKQTKWTPQQWAAWEKKQASKERGSPQWLVKAVVKHLATEQKLPEEQITARLIELGGVDFLLAGAESLGATRCRTKGAVLAAARALALYLDPDGAVMFKSDG